ncbi:GLPGLI family protein [Nonlabens dokdonensis]|uniref:Ribonuclease Z n=2 Tax=Nonlabens dokdonensis TaxID=328515 RepID=L7WD38_NONDD|nr:GLPGLI family protein [Nonlabens dokdonensis]AGC77831.1 ribonuclease Z [Nonlabens dokdonensis DSW-6]PZX39638.1 GLPGLI family protein [Nonlabens dokdonensis]
MKTIFFVLSVVASFLILPVDEASADFKGQAVYISKTKMDLGSWGARMSEAQKKQAAARLKNRLEKTYTLNFTKTESTFEEEDKLDAMSGATDSWGNNFTPGDQYKNIKEKSLLQSQEFYGKKFLVKDELLNIDWKMGSETKQIGKYNCFKAMATIPTADLSWYDFSWAELRKKESEDGEEAAEDMTLVEAWYTLEVPVSHGPAEYWGLPGLILEVSSGNTTMLCTKIVINPKEEISIEAPDNGKEITKKDYKATIVRKMTEMMNNRGRRRG